MNNESLSIRHSIHILASFRALLTVRLFFASLFALFTVYALITHQPIYSSYLFLLAILLPMILSRILKKSWQAREDFCSECFPTLCRRYHYSRAAYLGHSFSFYVLLFFLLLWQKSINASSLPSGIYAVFPLTALITGLISYLSLYFIYHHSMKTRLRGGQL